MTEDTLFEMCEAIFESAAAAFCTDNRPMHHRRKIEHRIVRSLHSSLIRKGQP